MLCGDLEEWDGGEMGGMSKREGISIYTYMANLLHWATETNRNL